LIENPALKLKELIDLRNVPVHIAIIMDGNGRWAKQQGIMDRVFGHRSALKAVRESIEGCGELGVKFLTLYAFSTENWNRPKAEVTALMSLLVSAIKDELPGMIQKDIRLKAIGDLSKLPATSRAELEKAIEITAKKQGFNLEFSAVLFREMGFSTGDSADCGESKKRRVKRGINRFANHTIPFGYGRDA